MNSKFDMEYQIKTDAEWYSDDSRWIAVMAITMYCSVIQRFGSCLDRWDIDRQKRSVTRFHIYYLFDLMPHFDFWGKHCDDVLESMAVQNGIRFSSIWLSALMGTLYRGLPIGKDPPPHLTWRVWQPQIKTLVNIISSNRTSIDTITSFDNSKLFFIDSSKGTLHNRQDAWHVQLRVLQCHLSTWVCGTGRD